MAMIEILYCQPLMFLLAVTALNGEIEANWDNQLGGSQPYFDNSTQKDVMATLGQTSLLKCRVHNLGDRAVSWIRKRDLHILTIGIITYTNDQRYQALHTDGSDEWILRIRSAQMRDSGTYECQVSTETKISQAFRFTVVVSKAKILGNPELYIKTGSNISLMCVVMQATEAPSFIYWYKDGRVINYSQRSGVSVWTEPKTKTSKLLIAHAIQSDSGNYTCVPSNSVTASVVVHVIHGEHPAAMHDVTSNNSSPNIVMLQQDQILSSSSVALILLWLLIALLKK